MACPDRDQEWFYIPKERQEIGKHFCSPPNCLDDYVVNETQSFGYHLEEKVQKPRTSLPEQPAHRERLQSEWDAEKAHPAEQARELSAIKHTVNILNTQLDEKTQSLATEDRLELARQEARAETLQKELEKSQKRVEQLAGELSKTRDSRDWWQSRANQKEKNIWNLQEHVSKLRTHSKNLQTEQNAYKAHIEELSGASNHWHAVADDLSQQLHNVLIEQIMENHQADAGHNDPSQAAVLHSGTYHSPADKQGPGCKSVAAIPGD